MVQPDRVEENGTLVPQQAMDAIPPPPTQAVQLFDNSRIFVHASQYHWYVEGIGDA